MTTKQSKAKGQKYKISFTKKNSKGEITLGSQDITGKDEADAIAFLEEYLTSGDCKKEDICINKVLLMDQSELKEFSVTYTWIDNEKKHSTHSDKTFAKDVEEAKKMIGDYVKKRHKGAVTIIFKKVELLVDGKKQVLENNEGPTPPPQKKAGDDHKQPSAAPDFSRKVNFHATITGENTVPKNGITVMTLKLEIAGTQVAEVQKMLRKYAPCESLAIEVAPLQVTMNYATPGSEPEPTQTNIFKDAINKTVKGEGDAEPIKPTEDKPKETASPKRESKKTAPKKETDPKVQEGKQEPAGISNQKPVNGVIEDKDPFGVDEPAPSKNGNVKTA